MIVEAQCPVCRCSTAIPFFDGGYHPLATLGWPQSSEEATSMHRFPHDFVQCPNCSHVWNRSFSYEDIPYQNNPNRMYNDGISWQGHLLTTRELVNSHLPKNPTVIDIGCGEGHFVRGLAESQNSGGRFIGFDPNTSSETGNGLEFYARNFDPMSDFDQFKPDALVIRHVLEHLTEPSVILERIAWKAASYEKPVWLFAEAPCIDRVEDTGRLADFFYEHPSHFTTDSFRKLVSIAGKIVELAHGYGREVIYALVQLEIPQSRFDLARKATNFYEQANSFREHIQSQLNELAATKTVAIWGGTGKAATFIHQFCADGDRFPLVVDSDVSKVGTFVPGTGQTIQTPSVLRNIAIDTIIIPTQWRAKDIILEMEQTNISCDEILIEHGGKLANFESDEHPYR